MKKYLEKGGRHWVSQSFISQMREKLGRLVSRLPNNGYHVYIDMTGSHEVFFIRHRPIDEFKGESTWEAKFHPGFEDKFRSFINIILRKEPMTRQRLVSKADFNTWTRKKLAAKAPSGPYGYTKKIAALCEGANRRIRKKASTLIKKAVRKDERVLDFLSVHAKRANSLPAKILLESYQDSMPKIACAGEACECMGSCGCGEDEDFQKEAAGFGGTSRELLRSRIRGIFQRYGGKMSDRTWRRVEVPKLRAELRLPNEREIHYLMAALKREGVIFEGPGGQLFWSKGKMAASRPSRYGMYGFSQKTAQLALQTCNDLRMEAGHIASDLHMRKSDLYGSITGFFDQHGKKARCASSKLLLSVYPEEKIFNRMASLREAPDLSVDEWLAFEPEP